DYLIKGRVTRDLLVRAIRYARERHRAQRTLRDLACIDSLTGLYNRRGFLSLCEQPLALARRCGRGLVLFLVDVDDMKQINDTFGHQMGDRALVETASILRASFRRSDIVARLGGDEFAVLSIDLLPQQVDPLLARLDARVEAHNLTRTLGYQLSLSVGFAPFEGPPTTSVDDLMAQADGALYVHKRGKRHACSAPEGSKGAASASAGCQSASTGWSSDHEITGAMPHLRGPLPLADLRAPCERARDAEGGARARRA
ncbi:MAG: GGDEF domain-containing protein, partial [Chloroflexota bacterium]|nr:GGDEF domain-containing protein [Chloroflexota bacterium]